MTAKGTILVTGGAGYIGSHTAVELLDNGYDVVIVDNLVNSKAESVRRIERITGKTPAFHQVDVCDEAALAKVFDAHPITGTIHFAALKAVGESVAKPLEYYQNNIGGLLAVLKVMRERNVRQFVFSSSATVRRARALADRRIVPAVRDEPVWPVEADRRADPARSRSLGPDVANRDAALLQPGRRARERADRRGSGRHPEQPDAVRRWVAVGKLEKLRVFGSDYPTPDGTGVRDYIHVVDLAKGHIAALDALAKRDASFVVNLGTGQGYSVLEVVRAFEKASGRPVPYELARRPETSPSATRTRRPRPTSSAGAQRSASKKCADHWRWQEGNPRGFV